MFHPILLLGQNKQTTGYKWHIQTMGQPHGQVPPPCDILRQRYLSSWCLEGVESFLGVASLLTLGSLLVGVGSRLSALSCPALKSTKHTQNVSQRFHPPLVLKKINHISTMQTESKIVAMQIGKLHRLTSGRCRFTSGWCRFPPSCRCWFSPHAVFSPCWRGFPWCQGWARSLVPSWWRGWPQGGLPAWRRGISWPRREVAAAALQRLTSSWCAQLTGSTTCWCCIPTWHNNIEPHCHNITITATKTSINHMTTIYIYSSIYMYVLTIFSDFLSIIIATFIHQLQ